MGIPPVSEADIQAYTDGSIAAERAAQVRRYLAARPAEWRRVLFYRRLNAQIRYSFPQPVHTPADTAVPPSRIGRLLRLWPVLAAFALAALLAAAAAGWLALAEPSQQVLNDAAVMAVMEAENAGTGGQNASMAEPFDLKAASLRLVSASTLELGPFASASRYVYENAEGKRLVLLGTRAWLAKDEPQWSARRVGRLRLIGWTAHGTRWVLAGSAETRGLMRAADIATMLPAGGRRTADNEIEQVHKDGTWASATN
ncbi:transcriptional regulator [Paraburkholderia sp. J12]|uniref:anti-sigma factor family protein n=1 Tax=Paraburkholderia sp. J12 TaxID=2805432 RepID=UPI002ABE8C04|nr:transcriptional regulator [Paraburkholderia sp. J12]